MKDFLKRFKTSFIISFLLSVLFLGIIIGFILLSDQFILKTKHTVLIILISFFLFFFSSLFLIQHQIERFVFSKVKVLYDEFYSDGIPVNESYLNRDAQSLTMSIQNFAKERKLEVELLKVKDNYRKEFIGNIAHEFKTPLFTVESYIHTLLDGAADDKDLQEKYLKKALQGVDRLNEVVKDLDLITKFEAGISSINIERFDLYDIIDEVLELMEIRAKKKNIELIFQKLISDKNLWVNADRKRISQVITNLIVNSLKYGVEGGTTEITLGLLSKQKILVRIIDNGTGIKEEHISRLFERFYRVDKARNRDTGGSGLGLAIVKHIIEAHQEKIYVQSTYGVGSEFSFSLSKTK
tara:strand:- start:742 stop:1800 length:1059 start_codon:yes stop_codon:yes gene_type:complete